MVSPRHSPKGGGVVERFAHLRDEDKTPSPAAATTKSYVSPSLYTEEPSAFEAAFSRAGNPQVTSHGSAMLGDAAAAEASSSSSPLPASPRNPSTSSNHSSSDRHRDNGFASNSTCSGGSHQTSNSAGITNYAGASRRALQQIHDQLNGYAKHERSHSMTRGGGRADAIGGTGRGTVATGDLGPQDDFETLEDLRSQAAELEADFNAKHGQEPLSGRVIHVSHYIPFVIRALAEVDHERRKEEQVSASATVAAMAAAARAKKAARMAELEAKKKEAEAEAARNAANDAQNKGEDVSSAKATPGRKPSFAANNYTLFDGAEIERRLAENQARSRLRGGRRAWMMTPVMDDEGDDDDDVVSLKDTYSPIGSRRPSRLSFSSRFSFSSNMDDSPISSRPRYGGGISDFEPSPAATPPRPPAEVIPPQWVLAPRRGHTALNSGIRSLCKTHRQTFIGWPGDVHFALQARQDERKDPSQTTLQERREIEEVLGSLDDPKNWRAQDAPVLGADPSMSVDGAPPTRKVPGPLMNGADPIASEAAAGAGKAHSANAGDDGTGGGAEYGIKYVPVWLDYDVAHGHYEGYCKTTLWPLFHYLLWQDVPGEQHGWEDYSWDAYLATNAAFAEKIAAEYRPGDVVWIHDYHLLLVPALLRKLVPDAHIGLFVHAPFPSSEIFRCLPRRREIIEGMLGADLACFQAFSYSRHFLSSCIRVCGYEASSNSVESSEGHVTHISYNSIGVDAKKIEKDSRAPEVAPKIQAIREMYKDKKIIIGRDKLDVVRGVVQKLQAFHKFLEEWPEWRNKVVLIQITAPSLTDSPMLERQVSELVSNINGHFGSLNHTPCIHYHQQLLREEYFALLSIADMALITSVRDGMNTTSMEYVLANQGNAPLILSEFTGTAGRMRHALQVNPWNTFGVARAIDYGLRMSQEERKDRHDELYRQIVNHTSHHWAISLMKQILLRLHSEQTAHLTPALDKPLLKEKFDKAKKRLILMDYDGTMTPIVKDPEAAVPSKRLLEALEKLGNDERNIIWIISGRDERFLAKHLGHLKIGFSAEHGGYVREPGSEEWQNLTKELDMSWMTAIRQVFEYYTERTSGSWIEQKKSSITWHYRNADPDYGIFQAKECQAHLDNFAAQEKFAVEIMVGKKNLEVRPLAVNKGEIVKRIAFSHPEAEFVFCCGDDRTDEDMMKFFCSLTPVNGEIPQLANCSGVTAGQGASSTRLSLPRLSTSGSHNEPTVLVGGGGGSIVAAQDEQDTAALVMSAPAPLSSSRNGGGVTGSGEQVGAGGGNGSGVPSVKTLALTKRGIFTTAIGAASKKTLARWHLDGPQSVIAVLATMADLEDANVPLPSAGEEEQAAEAAKEAADQQGRQEQ